MSESIHPDALDLRGAVVGRVSGQDPSGRPLVTWPGGGDAPGPADFLRDAGPIDWSACRGLRCLLVFPSGGGGPVVLGLLDAAPAGAIPEGLHGGGGSSPTGAVVPDYARLEGNRELILQCGLAKISLRADGRIVILGGYLLSRSTGVQKIQGASVQIN